MINQLVIVLHNREKTIVIYRVYVQTGTWLNTRYRLS